MFNEKNDPAELDKCPINCLMYAEAIVLISTGQEGLQNSVDLLSKYCNLRVLNVTTDKTKVDIFNKKRCF